MTAKGKTNASSVQIGDRVIVVFRPNGTVRESSTKTGDGVTVARVVFKEFRAASGPYEARGKYVLTVSVHGVPATFEAAPIQTMWLGPEDPAGIKRAHAEALADNAQRANLARVLAESVARAREAQASNL